MKQGHQEVTESDWNTTRDVMKKDGGDVLDEDYIESISTREAVTQAPIRRKKFSFTVVLDEFDENTRERGEYTRTGGGKSCAQQQQQITEEAGEIIENENETRDTERKLRDRSKSCTAKIPHDTFNDHTHVDSRSPTPNNNSPPQHISGGGGGGGGGDTLKKERKKPSPVRRKKYSFTVILDDYAQIEKFNNDLMRARACSTLEEEGSQAGSSASDVSAMNSSESIDNNTDDAVRKRSSSLISFRCSHEIFMGIDPPPTPTKSKDSNKNNNKQKLSPDQDVSVDYRRRASDTDIKSEKKRQKSIFSFRKQKKHRLSDAEESQFIETTFPKSLSESPISSTTSRKGSTISPKNLRRASLMSQKSATASPKLSIASRKSSTMSPKLSSKSRKESQVSPKLTSKSRHGATTSESRKSSTAKGKPGARKISLPFIKHVAPAKSIDDETSDEQTDRKEKRKMSKKHNVTFPANLDIQRNTILSSGDIDETTDCCLDTVVAMAELNKDFKKKPSVAFQSADRCEDDNCHDDDDVFSSHCDVSLKKECVLEYDLMKMRKKSTIVLTHPTLKLNNDRACAKETENISAYTNIVKAIEFATFEIGAKSMKKQRKASTPAEPLENREGGSVEDGGRRRRKSQHSTPLLQVENDNLKMELDDCKTSLIIISTINRLIDRRNAISEMNTTEPMVVKHAVKFLMQATFDERI